MTARPGAAADSGSVIQIPAKDFRTAVLDLALATHISVGGIDPSRCAQRSRPISGRLNADTALKRLFAGTHCTVTRVGQGIYRIDLAHVDAVPTAAAEPVTTVMVTGYRRPLPLGQTPGFTSAIPASRLDTHADNLSVAALRVPGFSETNLGPGRDKILLRGLSDGVFTGRTQSTVGLYLNDSPITYDAPDPDLYLTDMARIEVLEGPQGALYGEGSISGVVRLITRSPDATAFDASFATGIGATERGAASNRFDTMLNIPLIKHHLAVRLVAYDEVSGGYIRDTALGRDHINRTGRAGGRLAVSAHLSPVWKADLVVAAQSIDTSNSQYVSGGQGLFTRAIPLAEAHDNEFSQAAMSVTGALPWTTVKASLSHLHHHIDSRYDASDVITYLNAPASPPLAYDDARQVELTTGEITLSSPNSSRFRWLVGAYASYSHEDQTPQLSSVMSGTLLFTETRFDHIHDQALFGEVDYDLTPNLSLSAGFRAANDRRDTASQTTERAFAGPVVSNQQARSSGNHLSHSASLTYRLSDQLSLYVQSAEGYRNGGMNSTALISAPLSTPTYRGDELNTYEAGVRWHPQSPTAPSIDISTYRALWSNLQSDQLQASGLPITVNIGDAVVTGIEAKGQWQINPQLELFLTTLWNAPHLTRVDPNFATSEDNGLPFVSRTTVNLGADWKGQWLGLPADATADLSYASPSHLNFGPLQTETMNGFVRLDLSAATQWKRNRFEFRLDNALDVHGNSFAYGNPFSVTKASQITPIRPRTLWVTVRFRK